MELYTYTIKGISVFKHAKPLTAELLHALAYTLMATTLYFISIFHKTAAGYVLCYKYRKTSNISRTLVGNKIVENSDVDGASPVGAAPTTPEFSA